MILIFDTETTGFSDKSPIGSPTQPHIVQLAAMMTDTDGVIHSAFNFLIQPNYEGEIPEAASAVHGKTRSDLEQYGVPIRVALAALCNLAKLSTYIVGHNLAYDVLLVQHEMARLAKDIPIEFLEHQFDTMQAMTDICQLPGKFGKYKWPRLSEAYRFAFDRDLTDAHDAFGDVTATKDLFFWLKSKGHVK